MSEHRYSTFELDLYWIERADPELAAHLAECEQCGDYLAHLDGVDARPLALPRRRRWWQLGLVAAFVVAMICIVVWPRSKPPYVASKGAPSVQILVRRDGRVHVWDGTSPLRERDSIALQVACETMSRVTVFVRERDRWTQAFAGACVSEVLPFTLVVDDQPGSERIAIMFGQPIVPVLTQQFVFAKESK